MINFKQKIYSEEDKALFLDFLGVLSGFIVRSKNLHWSAPKNSIHVRLDELHDELGKYQDALAEGFMGIFGNMEVEDVVYDGCDSMNAREFIDEIIEKTKKFYAYIPGDVIFKGITGETESFIQACNKYKYLLTL